MDYKDQLESQKVKHIYHMSEDIRTIKETFSEFVDFLKSEKFETVIDLPRDCFGEVWSGNESRYVLANEPMENCRFMDGLLWNGHEWFIFSHWGVIECNKAKHYKLEKE